VVEATIQDGCTEAAIQPLMEGAFALEANQHRSFTEVILAEWSEVGLSLSDY
jgi:hypothetical protein